MSFIGRREPGFKGRLMVVFTPDRIFQGGPERAVRLRSTRRNRKLVGEVASRKARRSCPRFSK